MGSVLPREKLRVESVPWRRLTRSTGFCVLSADAAESALPLPEGAGSEAAFAEPEMVAARAKPEDFKNVRLLVGFLDFFIAQSIPTASVSGVAWQCSHLAASK